MSFRKRRARDDVVRLEDAAKPSFEYAGGFLPEDDDEKPKKSQRQVTPDSDSDVEEAVARSAAFEEAFDAGCSHCGQEFYSSYLKEHFDENVCDKCRKETTEDTYKLMTRTEARERYMLKDEDFDLRRPVLRFVCKKNPHNPRWGDMKLYCSKQVIARALLVHGSLDQIEAAKQARAEKASASQAKRRAKQLKDMKRAIRAGASSLQSDSVTKQDHVHSFGAESYNKTTDTYSQTCSSCGFKNSYEKL